MDIRETRILIVGAGTVGSYIAARLHEQGADVTLLTRPQRAEQITLRGVQITSLYGRFRKPIPAVAAVDGAPPFDVVILACRAHRIAEAATAVKPAIGPDTIVVSLIDGGPHLRRLLELITNCRAIDGLCEIRVLMPARTTRLELSLTSPSKRCPLL